MYMLVCMYSALIHVLETVYYSWYEHDGGGYILLEIMRPNTQASIVESTCLHKMGINQVSFEKCTKC